jgi:hypothetical protein
MVAWLGALIVEELSFEDIRERFVVGVDCISLFRWRFSLVT